MGIIYGYTYTIKRLDKAITDILGGDVPEDKRQFAKDRTRLLNEACLRCFAFDLHNKDAEIVKSALIDLINEGTLYEELRVA